MLDFGAPESIARSFAKLLPDGCQHSPAFASNFDTIFRQEIGLLFRSDTQLGRSNECRKDAFSVLIGIAIAKKEGPNRSIERKSGRSPRCHIHSEEY
jgi:hypothetical protein